MVVYKKGAHEVLTRGWGCYRPTVCDPHRRLPATGYGLQRRDGGGAAEMAQRAIQIISDAPWGRGTGTRAVLLHRWGGGSEGVRGGGRGGGQRMPLPRPPPPPLPTALPTDRINKRTQRKRGRKERTTKHREGVCIYACVHIERDRDCEMNRREKKQTTTREGERDTQADDTSGHETRRGLQQTKQRLQQQR